MIEKSDAFRLAELLCAHVCHDLAGPIGTLVGALEFVREQQPDSEEAGLAEEAANDIAQRLKLLRAAWGRTSEDLDVPRLTTFAAGLMATRKLQVILSGLDRSLVFPPHPARIVLNLLLLGAESIPGGGTITLSSTARGGILVAIDGPRAGWPSGLATWLMDEGSAWDALVSGARHVQGPLTALLARDHGLRLSMMMPIGAGAEADGCPPLLLDLGPQ
ncbi:MAG TPA: histidine phosphotransferase family protein [Acetobacteraceae bacterium]|nr:histidine phosphotransferase family protein [Acetobacteraceae bacterium]